jgi:hypothetical protein
MTHEEAVALISANARAVLGKLPAAQWRGAAMAASAELMRLANVKQRESGGWKVVDEEPDTVRPPKRSSSPTIPDSEADEAPDK